jgi:hypothetical protein
MYTNDTDSDTNSVTKTTATHPHGTLHKSHHSQSNSGTTTSTSGASSPMVSTLGTSPALSQQQVQQKLVFDKIALGVITYLESLDECHEIKFSSNREVQSHEFALWDKKYPPFKLPNDLKKFYSIFNGFLLQWNIELDSNETIIPIGEMRINSLEEIKILYLDFMFPQLNLPSDVVVAPTLQNCTVFTLDSYSSLGYVLLVYRYHASMGNICDSNPSLLDSPEIWLLTTTGQMIYICSSFTQYLRLMVTHLGIYHWQLAFSDDGLSQVSEQWMHLFCKERLIIDKHYR